MLQSLGEVWFLSEYWGAFIRDPIRGPSMSEAVPGDGPFSDFNLEADIMGLSAGTLTCLVIIGIMSLLIGHFFRKSVLPRILGRMFGREMKSGDMLGTRGSRAVGLAVTLVFFVEFVEILEEFAWFIE